MKELQHFGANADPDDILKILDRDGGVILDDVIAPELADAIMDELRPYVDPVPAGETTIRAGALIARSKTVREIIMNPRTHAMAERVLLRHCDRYRLILSMLIRILPGQPAQVLHRDRFIWGQLPRSVEPQLGCMWALSDFTAENGATQVVPGSSTWPDDREVKPEEIAHAIMRRGSVLVYTGTVYHGGGANTSKDQDRWGMLLNFGLGWIRQEEEQYLSCPPEVARTLTPELRELVGYSTGAYGLGYYSPPLAPGTAPSFASPSFAAGGDGALEDKGGVNILEPNAAAQSDSRVLVTNES